MGLFESTFRWIGAAVFTILVPGTVTVFLPYYILDRQFQNRHSEKSPIITPIVLNGDPRR